MPNHKSLHGCIVKLLNRKQFNNSTIQQFNNFKEGFSLVELLIGILIIGLISTFIASIYLSHFKLFSGQSLAISVADQNKIAMDEIVNTVRQGLIINYPNCFQALCKVGGSAYVQYFHINRTHLTIALWPLDGNGNPIDPSTTSNPNNCANDFVSYYLGTNNPTTDGTPNQELDGYYVLTRETAQYQFNGNSSCPTSRQLGKKIIATKISSINFVPTPTSSNATEVKITITNEGKALWKAFNPYTYSRTSLARLKNRPGSNFGPIPISFPYTLHGGTDGVRVRNQGETVIITGNVHSNANIYQLSGCGDIYRCSQIIGNASAFQA